MTRLNMERLPGGRAIVGHRGQLYNPGKLPQRPLDAGKCVALVDSITQSDYMAVRVEARAHLNASVVEVASAPEKTHSVINSDEVHPFFGPFAAKGSAMRRRRSGLYLGRVDLVGGCVAQRWTAEIDGAGSCCWPFGSTRVKSYVGASSSSAKVDRVRHTSFWVAVYVVS